jgi:outer membrane protein assembly factor BamB
LAVQSPAAEPWSTYRGNPQRTGNTDGVAGPDAPRVLWSFPSREHFIAAPMPAGDRLYVAGLGSFNVATFYCLSAKPQAEPRVLWSKTTPYLKLPTVSSPVQAGDKLVFGDGMHQTSGAFLHCLRSATGLPLWQLPVPGELVHLEGTPTIADGRVYIGGGAAGVMCVYLDRVSLDGKEQSLADVRKQLDQKWQELQAKYEADKKKDPDFAVPPNEDQLPKPAPLLAWQQGKGRWHVDAPVAVVGGRVFVASAFLDKEKEGDRALFCLDAATGKQLWRTPLTLNPWGGPSVVGNAVVISASTIGYDPGALKQAKGSVAAFDIGDGHEKWSKSVPGGVLSCVALADGLAVATATDGKVRAYDLNDGKVRWYHGDGKAAYFAAPAVVGGVVYVGDLSGVVHALGLADGQPRWSLDLGADPAVKASGMIYGGPVLHGGRLFVATCNLTSKEPRPTAVVCIGAK